MTWRKMKICIARRILKGEVITRIHCTVWRISNAQYLESDASSS